MVLLVLLFFLVFSRFFWFLHFFTFTRVLEYWFYWFYWFFWFSRGFFDFCIFYICKTSIILFFLRTNNAYLYIYICIYDTPFAHEKGRLLGGGGTIYIYIYQILLPKTHVPAIFSSLRVVGHWVSWIPSKLVSKKAQQRNDRGDIDDDDDPEKTPSPVSVGGRSHWPQMMMMMTSMFLSKVNVNNQKDTATSTCSC